MNDTGSPIKILIIDDEKAIRQSFADYLEDQGYEILIAENGLIGLDILKREKPQITLVDLRMPEMDGLEFLEKARLLNPEFPVIVISGANRINDVVKAQQLGSWDYLMKPVKELSMLGFAVEKALEKVKLVRENQLYQENLEAKVRERTADLELTNKNLAASEERYRTLFERSSDAIFLVDVKTGRYINANEAAERLTGYSISEIKLKTPIMLTPNGAKDQLELIQNLEDTKEFGEVTYVRADGTERIAILTAIPIQKGEVVVRVARDITKRKQADEAIQRYTKRLDALHRIDQAITGSLDLNGTLKILLDHLLTQLEVDAAAVLRYHDNLHTLEFAQGQGFHTTALQHTKLGLGESHAGEVALKRRHVFRDLTELDNEENPFFKSPDFNKEGFKNYYGVPLIAKGKMVGVLEIYNRSALEPQDDWVEYLDTLANQAAIAIDNVTLFNNLQRTNLELTLAYDATIEGWAQALEMRDIGTEGHSRRVIALTLQLAHKMGISDKDLVHIRRGALLHDIGKMGIPDVIMHKPGSLTKKEWEVMKRHPGFALEWLSPIEFLRPALDIPYCHHERWDGSGYPQGLKGKKIPLTARIFAVIDVWDALLSDRVYHKAWSVKKTLAYIKENSGILFDPEVIKTFFEVV